MSASRVTQQMVILLSLVPLLPSLAWSADAGSPTPAEVLRGLRDFYAKTARPDGSFAPGVGPDYLGMADTAYSDLAAVTYAVTVHKTFGWRLPHEEQTARFLLGRQKPDGAFVNVAGTVAPDSAQGRVYNTTQGLVALQALGLKPRHNPLPVFDAVMKQEYKELPAYTTSFFPLAYLAYGQPIPAEVDRKVRATMVQADDGYLHNHIAATFHAAHYYRLIGEPTPKADAMLQRILRDQKADGSWMLNLPSRDRHATFDAVFTLRQLGHARKDCRDAIARAARWVLSCRNPDGGFGHYPGSTSDADAVYFHAGTLVMAGFLPPADPPPKNPHLLSWGHLMPLPGSSPAAQRHTFRLPAWVGSVAFRPDGKVLAAGLADHTARLFDVATGREIGRLRGHRDYVAAVAFSPDGRALATAGYDHDARLWDAQSLRARHTLTGHRGVVMSVAFSPDGKTLATGSIDRTVRLWDTATGKPGAILEGHKFWVNAVAFAPDGRSLASGSSDGTIRLWGPATLEVKAVWRSTKAEVRSLAFAPDGRSLAAGVRYGEVQVWDVSSGKARLRFPGHKSDVWSVAFAPDGRTLFSGNGDWNEPGEVKRWDAATGKLLGTLAHPGEVLGVACSPDGQTLAAGGGDGTVKVWDIRPPEKRKPR